MMYFAGMQGPPGPIPSFAGPYNAATIYYRSSAVASVVSYGGQYWVAFNTQKNATNTWGTPMNGSADWQSIGIYFFALAGNSAAAFANSTGNTLLTATTPNQLSAVTLTGAAGTRILILDVTGQTVGNIQKVTVFFPTTTGILLDFRNALAGGTHLLPVNSGTGQAPNFPGNLFTSDGTIAQATFEFWFDGTQWNYLRSNIPA